MKIKKVINLTSLVNDFFFNFCFILSFTPRKSILKGIIDPKFQKLRNTFEEIYSFSGLIFKIESTFAFSFVIKKVREN
jgi:hypothetical protein